MILQQQSTIVFTQENTQNGIKLAYGGVAPVTSTTIDKNGRLTFDFTYAMFDFKEAGQMVVYIFNQQQMPLKGEIELLFYEVE